MKKIDILAVGAHPDDVELGVGGILASAVRMGSRVGVVDLTRGELASRGDGEVRFEEAQKAAEIMGVTWRKNLKLPDRGIEICPRNINLLTKLICLSRPIIVLAPFYHDIHPDHIQASELVRQAWFDSGLKKICSGTDGNRPGILAYYFLHKCTEPTIIVNTSSFYHIKEKAVEAHKSQFKGVQSGIKILIKKRDSYFGSLIGCAYGEGLYLDSPLAVNDLLALWGGGS